MTIDAADAHGGVAPVIIDDEASGSGRGSYPNEIGVALAAGGRPAF